LILSLDANVLIDLINDRKSLLRDRFEAASANGERLVVSALAAHEILYGALISARSEAQVRRVDELLDRLTVADFTREDAKSAAQVRSLLRSTGETIGGLDPLIAGQALNRGWAVVTGNQREFERVPGLQVINWSAPAENP
jgi:tRNA(fMet)-specific endonuclease VapC